MTPLQQESTLAVCIAGVIVQGVLSAYLSVLTAVAVEILAVFDRSNLLSFKDNRERVSQSLPPFPMSL